jgi:CHAT domain-containing protein
MQSNLVRLFVAIFILMSCETYAQDAKTLKLFEQKNYEAVKKQLLPTYKEGQDLPTVANLQAGCAHPVLLVRLLAEEFNTLKEDGTEAEQMLKRAEAIDELALYLLNTVALQEDKTTILKELLVIYGQAQELCMAIYDKSKDKAYLEKGFYFSEQYKSMLVKDALKEQEALSFGGIDEARRKAYLDLKMEIGELNKELMSEQVSFPVNEEEVKELSNTILQKNKELDQVYKGLEDDFAQYAALKNSKLNVGIQMVQNELLDDRSALLEYSMTDKYYYLYIITKNSAKCIEIASVDSLHAVLAPFIGVMVTAKEETLEEYMTKGFTTYQLLMQKALESLPENINRLVIVPDGKLHNLPFDVLPYKVGEELNDFSQVPYLLNKYIVSYSYTAALLKENKARQTNKNNLLLAVAADYGDGAKPKVNELRSGRTAQIRNALAPLPFAREEVEKLKGIFEGNFFFDAEANEAKFKENASKYAVIHLAMHGLADSKNPALSGLAFTENMDEEEDNILYLHEINNLNLNSELVVLSACETGIGSFEAGAGVMSVARSFMYAGSASVIMTLWPVNDQATQIIMEDFYALLQEGEAKDVALRKAKLDYIKNVGDLKIAAHPVLWGPYIQLGDDQAIVIQENEEYVQEEAAKESSNWLWYGLGALGLLVIGGLFAFSRKKK